MRRILSRLAIAPAVERTIAIVLGLWWIGMLAPELGGPGMSDQAVSWSVWGCLALVVILVTLIWVRRTQWRALGVFAWILLALLAAGIRP